MEQLESHILLVPFHTVHGVLVATILEWFAIPFSTLMAESEEELKSLLMRVKEESEKPGVNLTFKKLRSWHPFPSLQDN